MGREQLEDNLAAANLKLTQEEIRKLDDVSALPPEYPGWMVGWQIHGRVDPATRQVVEDVAAVGK
jgi:diketogulonate reductase-like aldo/keto reductase